MKILIGSLILLFAALPARANPALPFAEALPWSRIGSAPAGDWAEYMVRVGEHPVGPWLRFLVVGPAADGGTWLEIWISERPGSATQAYRLLVDAHGRTRRVIGRMLGGASRELPIPEVDAEGPPPDGAVEFVELGEESVPTRAGALRAVRTEARRGAGWLARAWLAQQVPVFGLVRLDLASGAGLELHRWGRGGKGVVTVPAAGSAPARTGLSSG
jgi:hypothetical protein